MKRRGIVFIVSSPSGGGKSSLIGRVLKGDGGLTLSTSHTSRAPRPGEKDGREYHFVSRREFLAMRRRGEFVESVRLHGNYYGTSRGELDRLTGAGRDILLDIDVKGARNVMKLYPEAVSVFILPPSLKVLEERLHRRGSEDEEQIRVRLDAAVREMRASVHYRYAIVNDVLDRAAGELKAVVTAERLHLPRKELRALLRELFSAPK